MTPRKQSIFAILTILLASSMAWLLAEVGYELWRQGDPGTSLTWQVIAGLGISDGSRASDDQPALPDLRLVADPAEFEVLLDQFKAAGVGIGNSPYSELRTEQAKVNIEIDGCLTQKPNLDKTMTFLRSNLFNSFDPPNAFYDTAAELPKDVADFIACYSFRKIRLRSNGDGERLTFPAVSSSDKVIIAGDSVANGSMVSDEETLASQLQAVDTTRQYVNIGVASAKAGDVVCNLARAAARYSGQIRELIYIFCENDFAPKKPYGRLEDLIAWLQDFATEQKIYRLTLVYVPYIYNSSPDVTRIDGHMGAAFSFFSDEKTRLLAGARSAGFRVIDYLETTQRVRQESGSQFAAMALHVDHTHLSRQGISLLVDQLRDGN